MSTPSKLGPSGSIKGYLDIKIPARKRKSISLFRVQVWKRRCWIVIRGDRSPADINISKTSRSDQVNLSVEIYTQHEGANHPTEGTILHLDLVHKIRRAKSKSHPYAFEVCGRRGETLLYLSGSSETQTQKWMSAIRTILWPPNHLENIQNTYRKSWEVSAITVGELGSDWTSLGDLYGRLVVADANILIKDVHNGTTKVEWPLITIQRIYVTTGGELEDEGKIFIIQTRPSHPYGESFLYFFSLELCDLLEGLHDAVSILINKNSGDNTSVLSDLSELSGALNTVITLPPQLQESSDGKMRKSTSVLGVSDFTGCSSIMQRLSSSHSNLTEDETVNRKNSKVKYLTHFRRRSMSEANLNKLCFDETDEELDSREDDLEDIDLRPLDVPKDRTSSSGSYNSYRSNDSGVKLSASPSNYGDNVRSISDNAVRRLVSKSDSLDSGVKACLREDVMKIEIEDRRRTESPENKLEFSKNDKGKLNEEPDFETKVGEWCLQSAKARKLLLLKNLNMSGHKDYVKMKGLSRTFSESYKEIVGKKNSDDLKPSMDSPNVQKTNKHTTVYEEIVDVLRPLNEKKQQIKEHDYEDLEKYRRDIKRSHSFQDKTKPPPLPPRRPKSFSPDPWNGNAPGKTNALRKLFGLSFYNKSHSQDSMLDIDNADFEARMIAGQIGNDDMATVQALGTLPRIKRKTLQQPESRFGISLSPKQKNKKQFGKSPNISPQRPKNLFNFKLPEKEELMSPNTQAALKLHKQLTSHSIKTPSTDSSLQDISTPNTPGSKSQCQSDLIGESDERGDASTYMKSPKIVSKTFNLLKKFPKDKYSSMERKRKSAIFAQSGISNDPSIVPSSFSMDNFSVDEAKKVEEGKENKAELNIRPRAMSFAPCSPAMQSHRKSCCYASSNPSPVDTPLSCPGSSIGFTGSLPHSGLPWKERQIYESFLPPPPPLPREPQYANMGSNSDSEYMTVEELQANYTKNKKDDGGYLSMGDLRNRVSMIKKEKPPLLTYGKTTSVEPTYSTTHLPKEDYIPLKTLFKDDKPPCPPHCQCNNKQMFTIPKYAQKEDAYFGTGYKSAPSSRKPSCCDASDYLTPQEVSRLLRRELVSARVREIPVEQHLHHYPTHHHHHPYHH